MFMSGKDFRESLRHKPSVYVNGRKVSRSRATPNWRPV